MNQTPSPDQLNQTDSTKSQPRQKKGNGPDIASIVVGVISFILGAGTVTFLVLNAATESQQSQSSSARLADIDVITQAVDEYLGATNQPPKHWDDLAPLIGESLQHYEARGSYNQSINLAGSWDSLPTRDGDILIAGEGGLGIDPAWPENTTSGRLFDDNREAVDLLLTVSQAGCNYSDQVSSRGLLYSDVEPQSIAIIYWLEGRSETSCLEI